jgi:hypothetical protein
MKLKSSLSFFIVLSLSIATFAQKKQTLFNGKDLSGWKIYGTENSPILTVVSFLEFYPVDHGIGFFLGFKYKYG